MLEILVSISINEKYAVVARKITVAADTGGSRKPVLVTCCEVSNNREPTSRCIGCAMGFREIATKITTPPKTKRKKQWVYS